GVVPTPVVAFETHARGADLGIMITASHNPPADNGLKFFERSGLKLAYERARRWSATVQAETETAATTAHSCHGGSPEHYRRFVLEAFQSESLARARIAFDFAHGAASGFARDLVRELLPCSGFIGDQPNGHNINLDVGALHTHALGEFVREGGYELGFALDGDGDRLVVVDAAGELHGDWVLYALKDILVGEGRRIASLVGTIMHGMGL